MSQLLILAWGQQKVTALFTLEKIGNEEVDVQILLAGVGGITETDVVLAAPNQALIIGFNVRSDLQAKKVAKQHNINIKYYSIMKYLLF